MVSWTHLFISSNWLLCYFINTSLIFPWYTWKRSGWIIFTCWAESYMQFDWFTIMICYRYIDDVPPTDNIFVSLLHETNGFYFVVVSEITKDIKKLQEHPWHFLVLIIFWHHLWSIFKQAQWKMEPICSLFE